jgi:hypothetical protein
MAAVCHYLGQCHCDRFPDPGFAPSSEPPIDGVPTAIFGRHVTPRRTAPEPPKDTVDDSAVLLRTPAPFRLVEIAPTQACLQKAALNQAIVRRQMPLAFDRNLKTAMQKLIYDEGAEMSRFSPVVAEGMKRVCADFSGIVCQSGFHKTKNRTWVRINDICAECIYFHRLGSTYGAPATARVDIRVMLSIRVLNAPVAGGAIGISSDKARRATGYAYHHRFNAETGSTYDRCVEELGLYLAEVAEPWFAEWRDPQKLMTYVELGSQAREGLKSAIAGSTNPETVAASLKALGVKVPR